MRFQSSEWFVWSSRKSRKRCDLATWQAIRVFLFSKFIDCFFWRSYLVSLRGSGLVCMPCALVGLVAEVEAARQKAFHSCSFRHRSSMWVAWGWCLNQVQTHLLRYCSMWSSPSVESLGLARSLGELLEAQDVWPGLGRSDRRASAINLSCLCLLASEWLCPPGKVLARLHFWQFLYSLASRA